MKAHALAALVAVSLIHAGAQADTRRADRGLDSRPAPASRYMPKRGAYDLTGRFTVDLMSFDDVQRICPPAKGLEDYPLGCVDCAARRITIVEPGDRRIRYQFREVFEHEAAHCDGYDHP